jgi:hypothetical protein
MNFRLLLVRCVDFCFFILCIFFFIFFYRGSLVRYNGIGMLEFPRLELESDGEEVLLAQGYFEHCNYLLHFQYF